MGGWSQVCWFLRDKHSMNTIAVRYLKLADKLIKGTEKGIFPGWSQYG